jgi:hypothetical protein
MTNNWCKINWLEIFEKEFGSTNGNWTRICFPVQLRRNKLSQYTYFCLFISLKRHLVRYYWTMTVSNATNLDAHSNFWSNFCIQQVLLDLLQLLCLHILTCKRLIDWAVYYCENRYKKMLPIHLERNVNCGKDYNRKNIHVSNKWDEAVLLGQRWGQERERERCQNVTSPHCIHSISSLDRPELAFKGEGKGQERGRCFVTPFHFLFRYSFSILLRFYVFLFYGQGWEADVGEGMCFVIPSHFSVLRANGARRNVSLLLFVPLFCYSFLFLLKCTIFPFFSQSKDMKMSKL